MEINNLEDINALILNEVEESTMLEYKRTFPPIKSNQKGKEELAKDVSAMANANGGLILYGIAEKETSSGHSVPCSVTPIPTEVMTKDRLCQMLSSIISPVIQGLEISYLPCEEGCGVFIVRIPQSRTAHQNLLSHQYHIRRNATISVMEDHEIRDVMNRESSPILSISGCNFFQSKASLNDDSVEYKFIASISNKGVTVSELYKLNVYINMYNKHFDIVSTSKSVCSHTLLSESRLKLSFRPTEPIFPNEIIQICDFTISFPKIWEQRFVDNMLIDMILLFQHDNERLLYLVKEKRYIDDKEEMLCLLKKYHGADCENLL